MAVEQRARVALDLGEVLGLLGRDERHGLAGALRAARAADAVDVVLRLLRRVVVDHVRDAVHVDAARGDVGGDEHFHLARLEAVERALALVLRAVAVHGRGLEALLGELLRDAVGAALGAREDEHAVDGLLFENADQQVELVGALDGAGALAHGVGSGADLADADLLRLVEHFLGQLADLVRHGGREQQRLALLRHGGDDGADVADKAHVEHPVGLVEDEDVDVRDVDAAALHVVEQTARRGDEHVDACLERLELRPEADAAEDGGAAEVGVLAVDADGFLDLEREFARRRDDEGADGPAARAGRERLRDEPVDHRQHEGGRFAGARLSAADQVGALDGERDGLGLDGGGVLVAGVEDAAENGLGKPELTKRNQVNRGGAPPAAGRDRIACDVQAKPIGGGALLWSGAASRSRRARGVVPRWPVVIRFRNADLGSASETLRPLRGLPNRERGEGGATRRLASGCKTDARARELHGTREPGRARAGNSPCSSTAPPPRRGRRRRGGRFRWRAGARGAAGAPSPQTPAAPRGARGPAGGASARASCAGARRRDG